LLGIADMFQNGAVF